jgi:hypothetical protein
MKLHGLIGNFAKEKAASNTEKCGLTSTKKQPVLFKILTRYSTSA